MTFSVAVRQTTSSHYLNAPHPHHLTRTNINLRQKYSAIDFDHGPSVTPASTRNAGDSLETASSLYHRRSGALWQSRGPGTWLWAPDSNHRSLRCHPSDCESLQKARLKCHAASMETEYDEMIRRGSQPHLCEGYRPLEASFRESRKIQRHPSVHS